MKTIVSEKGQITIPKRLRERLGIGPGTVLDFTDDRGRLIGVKESPLDPIDALFGVLRTEQTTDELIDDLRGDSDDA